MPKSVAMKYVEVHKVIYYVLEKQIKTKEKKKNIKSIATLNFILIIRRIHKMYYMVIVKNYT